LVVVLGLNVAKAFAFDKDDIKLLRYGFQFKQTRKSEAAIDTAGTSRDADEVEMTDTTTGVKAEVDEKGEGWYREEVAPNSSHVDISTPSDAGGEGERKEKRRKQMKLHPPAPTPPNTKTRCSPIPIPTEEVNGSCAGTNTDPGDGMKTLLLPHPSGVSHFWNRPADVAKATTLFQTAIADARASLCV
jgi:hypothetical protein